MSDLKLPSLHDYWSTDPFLATHGFEKALSRDRFMDIHGNLHVTTPNESVNEEDKLRKLRPMMKTLSNSYQRHMQPSNELTIDEECVLLKEDLC